MTNASSGIQAAIFASETRECIVENNGANKGLVFVSLNGATPSIEVKVAGNNTALSVSVVGNDVTVNSATDGGGVATSTAAQIKAAMEVSDTAKLLFRVRYPEGHNGSGIVGALAKQNGSIGVAFTALNLADSGDHLNYQAAYGSRYWDRSQALTIERQEHGAGGWSNVTSSVIINYLQGKITVPAAYNDDDKFRANGYQRVLIEVADAYNMEPSINNRMSKDVSSFQKLFSEFIPLKTEWSATAKKWFVDPTYIDLILGGNGEFVAKMCNMFIAGGDVKALVGDCRMEKYTWQAPNDDVMLEDWQLKGSSKDGLFWEDN